MSEQIPAVLLAGGLGTRLREETEFRPKPMVEIGNQPVLWHIMKNLSTFDFKEFILCTGYKGNQIKDYFLNYQTNNNDFSVSLNDPSSLKIHNHNDSERWKVTVADTGLDTMTGGRVKKIEKYVAGRTFLVTYGDGLADINIDLLLEFHRSHGKIATVTTARPTSRFGVMDIDSSGNVRSFREKPKVEDWINIGFFVFEPRIFDFLDDNCILEQAPLAKLAQKGELNAFKHTGFWEPMDTFRESQMLNQLWVTGNAPWRNWQ